MAKVYSCAPLPFMGQKRGFVKDFKEALHTFQGIDTVVDLFGGSGLLAHIAKREMPSVRVIYNDFDYYEDRIHHIDETNSILAALRPLLGGVPDNKKVPDELKAQILRLLKSREAAGRFVDYLTLSASLLFSGKWAVNYEEFSKQTLYNTIRKVDYNADGYLDGLEIVHSDYRALFRVFKGRNVLFVLDPPYLSTGVGAYQCYWKLADYLDVLSLLPDIRYIYFTSDKSQLLELCAWLRDCPLHGDPFEGADIRQRTNSLNYNANFKDIMLIKR